MQIAIRVKREEKAQESCGGALPFRTKPTITKSGNRS